MESLNEEARRKVILTFFQNNAHHGKLYTVQHFRAMNIRPSTTYRILRRLGDNLSAARKPGSGGSNKIMNGNQMRALKTLAIDRVGVSSRRLASRFRVSKSTINRALKNMGAICRARTKAPLYTPEQLTRTQERSKKLAVTLRNRIVIMDDESYFSMKNDRLSGNDRFYTLDYSKSPAHVKYACQKKYPRRLLVWLAISQRGISEPYFLPSGGAMNGDTYRKQCIKARLLPFIKNLHKDDDILFWPDGASAHYAKATTELLEAENIHFVAKLSNPPNIPQVRSIENVWALLKAEVYRDGWEASTMRSLKIKIKKSVKKLNLESIQRDLEKVQSKLAKIGHLGVFSVLK